MPASTQQLSTEELRQVTHDLKHCLHVIGMGATLLREVRENDEKFAEICRCIDHERREAMKLVEVLSSGKEGTEGSGDQEL